MTIDYKLIGKRIKAIRQKCGYAQSYLAAQLDVSIGYVSQVERGVTKINLELLSKISAVLKCNITELIGGSTVLSHDYFADEILARMEGLGTRNKKLVFNFIELLLQSE